MPLIDLTLLSILAYTVAEINKIYSFRIKHVNVGNDQEMKFPTEKIAAHSAYDMLS